MPVQVMVEITGTDQRAVARVAALLKQIQRVGVTIESTASLRTRQPDADDLHIARAVIAVATGQASEQPAINQTEMEWRLIAVLQDLADAPVPSEVLEEIVTGTAEANPLDTVYGDALAALVARGWIEESAWGDRVALADLGRAASMPSGYQQIRIEAMCKVLEAAEAALAQGTPNKGYAKLLLPHLYHLGLRRTAARLRDAARLHGEIT